MARKRWPDGADKQRRNAIAAIEELRKNARNAAAKARQIHDLARRDPIQVEMLAAKLETLLVRIELDGADAVQELLYARLGVEGLDE